MTKPGWTEVPDLVDVIRRRWEAGRYLRAYASGDGWEPIQLPVKGPSAEELLHRFGEAQQWASRFVADATPWMEVEHRSVGGRSVGANRLPARVRIPTFEKLCALLDTEADVRALEKLITLTRERMPGLVAWACEHPQTVLDHRDSWNRVLATVAWIATNDTTRIYLRQVDVEGVDTKFVERHRKLLTQLLPLVLPDHAVDTPIGSFELATRFRTKPSYTRLRILDPTLSHFPRGITELTLRTDELARRDFAAATVFIVENEVTFLAFPAVPQAIVVFGSGFASAGLAGLPWLHEMEVVYWGDIDTHGFDILSRLRGHLPEARSILMDRQTLLSHRIHWTTEDNPTRRPLDHLTEHELSTYSDLTTDTYGIGVRLEQERVRFSKLEDALRPWTSSPAGASRAGESRASSSGSGMVGPDCYRSDVVADFIDPRTEQGQGHS